MTRFDDLSIDLLIKIFNYLTFTEFFHAFFGLQKRLNDVIQDYPKCINLSKIMNCINIQQFSFKCRSLILSGSNLHSFQMKYSHLNLTSLRVVIFKKMDLVTLYSFIEKLPMQQLESITVEYFTWHYYPKDAYKQIWSIIMNSINGNCLRYLHLPYHIRYWNTKEFSYDFSTLKYVILEYISVSQMLTFMSYCPNLRRFKAFIDAPHRDLFRYTISLPKLDHLILNLQDEWTLEEIQQLLTICPYLKYLILKLQTQKETTIIFEPATWQTLIDNKLPYLIFLRLRLNCIIAYSDTKLYNFQETFNHAEYWLRRQPHFQVKINIIQQEIL
ncbi:unnamed protein product [Rotaria sordida]|uniref:F-box domain-containing protein n=1 Tax=Rotaria sordida TaxID=392033 RepID=A0A819UCD9_9BILA|nr:unnamed protein product [Rotaria sordida]CAF4091876.1 unnamed protein product [Rotaria sordida]